MTLTQPTPIFRAKRGRDRILALTRTADVVLEAFRPGAMEKLGLDPDQLRELNPRLVYPHSRRPAVTARTASAQDLTSCPGQGRPRARQVAEWAGPGVDVLLRIYAKCVEGQNEVAN
jgi:hypothetical protein